LIGEERARRAQKARIDIVGAAFAEAERCRCVPQRAVGIGGTTIDCCIVAGIGVILVRDENAIAIDRPLTLAQPRGKVRRVGRAANEAERHVPRRQLKARAREQCSRYVARAFRWQARGGECVCRVGRDGMRNK
jgi:hypothetical protein